MADNELLAASIPNKDFLRHRKEQAKKEKRWKTAAIPFVAVATTALSTTGTIALHLLKPGIPLPVLIALGISGLLVDGLMYWGDVRKTFALFYGKGLFRDLHDYIIEEYLFKKLQKAIETKLAISGFLNEDDLEKIQSAMNNIEKEVDNEYPNTAQDTKHGLIKKRKKEYLHQLIRDIITHWRTLDENLSSKHTSLLDQGAHYINSTVLPATKKEYLAKRILSTFGVIVGFISGFAFGCMIFIHFLELNIPGILILSGIIASLAGICFSKLMFKTLYTMVKKNVFKQIWHKLNLSKPEDIKWPEHIARTVLRLALALIIVAIGLTATILLAGSLLDASIGFLSFFFAAGTAPTAIVITSQVLLLGILLPVKSVFAISHSLGAVSKIGAAIQQRVEWLRDEKTTWGAYFEDIKANPARTVLYAAAVVVIGALSLFHFISEAAFGAGEGATAENSWPSEVFQNIANTMNMDPNDAGLMVATTSESLEHGDFVLKQGEKLAKGISELKVSTILKDLRNIPTKISQGWRATFFSSNSQDDESLVEKPAFTNKELEKFGYSPLTIAVLPPPKV